MFRKFYVIFFNDLNHRDLNVHRNSIRIFSAQVRQELEQMKHESTREIIKASSLMCEMKYISSWVKKKGKI